MADDNKEALDRLEMQNQKLLGDPREIDASFVQTMHDGLSEDRAETQSFMRYFVSIHHFNKSFVPKKYFFI